MDIVVRILLTSIPIYIHAVLDHCAVVVEVHIIPVGGLL
jgi:hypothetical protein